MLCEYIAKGKEFYRNKYEQAWGIYIYTAGSMLCNEKYQSKHQKEWLSLVGSCAEFVKHVHCQF